MTRVPVQPRLQVASWSLISLALYVKKTAAIIPIRVRTSPAINIGTRLLPE
jgi:hypothetical protein